MGSRFLWGLLLKLGRVGFSVVLCVTILVSAGLTAYVVKQIMVEKPLIEWHSKDGVSGKIDFPVRSATK